MLWSNPKDLFMAHIGTIAIHEVGYLIFLLFFNSKP